MPGRLLFTGKFIDVKRDINKASYIVGRCLLSPRSGNKLDNGESAEKRYLVIPFQNEFLYVIYTDPEGKEETEIICMVPGLI
jgi:DUF917 family protein